MRQNKVTVKLKIRRAPANTVSGAVRLVSRPLTPGERRRLCDLLDRIRRASANPAARRAVEKTQKKGTQ